MGQNGGAPQLTLTCDCGFEATGTEEELIPVIQEHVSEAHNRSLTEEQAFARVRIARATPALRVYAGGKGRADDSYLSRRSGSTSP